MSANRGGGGGKFAVPAQAKRCPFAEIITYLVSGEARMTSNPSPLDYALFWKPSQEATVNSGPQGCLRGDGLIVTAETNRPCQCAVHLVVIDEQTYTVMLLEGM